MVQLSATRCSCIGILWVSLVTFAAINLCVASQRVFIVVVVVYFVIDLVRTLLDATSYVFVAWYLFKKIGKNLPLPLFSKLRGRDSKSW
jgi:hypothetical protein